MMALTEKQKRFCNEYLIDLNATQAAVRAGYSEKTATRIASENLTKPNIRQYISKRQQERQARTGITQDMVLREMAKLAFFDPRKLFDEKGKPKDIPLLDEDTAAALAGLDVTEVYEGRGAAREFVGYVKKYKFSDKKGALDSIARHLGMFNDRLALENARDKTFEVNIKVVE